jgi:UDP-N-acetyl-D-mannosaminuronic acid transferase (WecB/TagA/CpsF family)
MCYSSEDNHEMEYLMAATKYIVPSGIPSLRNLKLINNIVELIATRYDCFTMVCYNMEAAPRRSLVGKRENQMGRVHTRLRERNI